jgi:predicted porin
MRLTCITHGPARPADLEVGVVAGFPDAAGLGRAIGVAALLAGLSTTTIAAAAEEPPSRDARIQQLQDEVRQLLADHRRLQAEDAELTAKAQQIQSAIAALQGEPAAPPPPADTGAVEGIRTLGRNDAERPTARAAKFAKPEDSASNALTWRGITLYGTVDVGVGWVSHGLPENGFNYEGESLVNRNGYKSQFLIEQNNLSQTSLGVRGKEEIVPGWSAVFNASTGINPQSGQLANMAATNTLNAGLPRSSYSYAGDGARAGQAFNDELYAGVSSPRFGTLTFGRQRALGTDAMLAYDPAGGAYAFSFIGYNGLMAGGGDTQDTRWDDALKYRVGYGPVHLGAMYKFVEGAGGCYAAAAGWSAATCTPEQPHNTAYAADVGGAYGGFSADLVVQHINQAISVVNPLLGASSPSASYQATTDSINTIPITGANVIGTTNTEYGIVTDNTAVMIAAKYSWYRFKIFGGYEHIRYVNPAHPLGVGASAQGDYLLSGVEDNNLDSPKIVQVFWTGVKFALDTQSDITLSYYFEDQNDFRVPSACSATAGYRSSCAGSLSEISLYADHRLTRRFDIYSGIAYSDVTGGLAIAVPHGPGTPYYFNNNIAPTVGGRFAF